MLNIVNTFIIGNTLTENMFVLVTLQHTVILLIM